MTYLSPTQTPITNYETLTKAFSLSNKLAPKANMEYVYLIGDVGAAIKTCHLI